MSGKSTAAYRLRCEHDATVLPFARTLKRMAAVLLMDIGLSHEEVHWSLNDGKEDAAGPVAALLGVTPRCLMQLLGTEWGRELIDSEIWVRAWKGQAIRLLGEGRSVVCDDARFPNEAQAIKDLGGVMVRLLRPDGGSASYAEHASEGALANWSFDHTLINDRTIDALHLQVDELFSHLHNHERCWIKKN